MERRRRWCVRRASSAPICSRSVEMVASTSIRRNEDDRRAHTVRGEAARVAGVRARTCDGAGRQRRRRNARRPAATHPRREDVDGRRPRQREGVRFPVPGGRRRRRPRWNHLHRHLRRQRLHEPDGARRRDAGREGPAPAHDDSAHCGAPARDDDGLPVAHRPAELRRDREEGGRPLCRGDRHHPVQPRPDPQRPSWWSGFYADQIDGRYGIGRHHVYTVGPASGDPYSTVLVRRCGAALVRTSLAIVVGRGVYSDQVSHMFFLDRNGRALLYWQHT